MAIPITLRKKIADFDPIREGITVQQFCKNIGVSKQTYYNIKARIAERGRAGIVPDSTAPLNPRRVYDCLLYTSPSPRDATLSRMPSSA